MKKYPDELKTPIEKGEEQMTTDYAVEWIKQSMCYWGSEFLTEWVPFKDERHIAGEMAIEALENAEKYKWHDLRKNPNDLPNEYENVLVYVNNRGRKTYSISWKEPNQYGGRWRKQYASQHYANGSVIAWREIEPFEEGEEKDEQSYH